MPDWLPDFLSTSLLVSPSYATANAIWNVVMSACIGMMQTTPQGFSAIALCTDGALSVGIIHWSYEHGFVYYDGIFQSCGKF